MCLLSLINLSFSIQRNLKYFNIICTNVSVNHSTESKSIPTWAKWSNTPNGRLPREINKDNVSQLVDKQRLRKSQNIYHTKWNRKYQPNRLRFLKFINDRKNPSKPLRWSLPYLFDLEKDLPVVKLPWWELNIRLKLTSQDHQNELWIFELKNRLLPTMTQRAPLKEKNTNYNFQCQYFLNLFIL